MFPNTCHCCLHSMNPISTFYMIAANFNYFFNHFNIHLLYLCFDPLSSRNQFRLILIHLIPLQTPCIPRMKQRIKTDIETAYMQIWGTRTSICVLFEVIAAKVFGKDYCKGPIDETFEWQSFQSIMLSLCSNDSGSSWNNQTSDNYNSWPKQITELIRYPCRVCDLIKYMLNCVFYELIHITIWLHCDSLIHEVKRFQHCKPILINASKKDENYEHNIHWNKVILQTNDDECSWKVLLRNGPRRSQVMWVTISNWKWQVQGNR